MKLSQLLASGDYRGFMDVEISDIVYDSRKAKAGCAFVCLRRLCHGHAHKFVANAAAAGAAAIIAQEPVEASGGPGNVLVEDTRGPWP